MKFPYSMLLDFVQTSLNAEAVGDLLTMAGFELEGIEDVEGEPVLDIKVMSNRGDGLSVFGLAREVLAKDAEAKPTDLYRRAAARFHAGSLPPQGPNPATVEIETEDCSRYACRYWQRPPNGDSPEWIQSRLRKAGMRPISNLVDLTNYVMLELGQPLHAFDFDSLHGAKIRVRKATSDEKLTTLNGEDHELRPDQMMICDADRPVAVAGVMGGLDTEVTGSTTGVLLESAHFNNVSVRRTRKQLGLNTEASYRFERSVDPEGVVAAIERFTELLGVPGSDVVDVYPNKPHREAVGVRLDRARRLLGMDIKHEAAKSYLERLGMEVAGHGDPYYVVPPTWRPDIVREEDLIEEIGRVHGYDRIPEALPYGTTTMGGPQGALLQADRLREQMVRLGFAQIVSHSMRDTHPLDSTVERIGPREPVSPDAAFLRNSLLPSLSDAALRNGARDLHLFEIGQTFGKSHDGYVERKSLGVLSTGLLLPSDRKGEPVPQAEFFSLKGVLEDALVTVGYRVDLRATDEDARMHPSRQASIVVDELSVGVCGQIHPEIARELNLPEATLLAELDIDLLFAEAASELKVRPISRNPAVRRDIALLVDRSVSWDRIDALIVTAAGDVLERRWVFDDYSGANLPEGKHSLGIALQLRKMDENFTDEEANQVRDKVVAALAELGATTR